MNIIGNRKLISTIKGNIPELTVLPQIHYLGGNQMLYCTRSFTKFTYSHVCVIMYYHQQEKKQATSMEADWRLQAKKDFDSLPHTTTKAMTTAPLTRCSCGGGDSCSRSKTGYPQCGHSNSRSRKKSKQDCCKRIWSW